MINHNDTNKVVNEKASIKELVVMFKTNTQHINNNKTMFCCMLFGDTLTGDVTIKKTFSECFYNGE